MAYNLLDYTGNAGLGAGSSGIDVGAAGANLNGLNKTLNDVMLLTADRNMKVFQQKVKDRDDLNQLIAQGRVAMGDIDPKDVPRFNAATQKVQDIYLKNPNILNDKKAYAEYQGAVREAQDIATHAQTRWKMLADLRQQKAKETLPWKQAAIQSHIDQQEAKPFWDQIDPFQQLHDLNMDNITKRGVEPVTTTYNDPKDPLKSYSTTYFDYGNIAKNKASDFMAQGEPAYDMIQFRDKILGLSQPEQAKFADNINGQIDKYNQSRGLIQGQQGFVDHIGQAVKDPQTGVPHVVITESAPELAAKVALASQGSFVTKTPLIKPEDQLKDLREQEKIAIDQGKAQAEEAKDYAEAAKDRADIAKVKLEGDKIKKELSGLAADPGKNNVYDKIMGKLKTDSKGQEYVLGSNITDLDLAMLSGFSLDPKSKSIIAHGRLTDPAGTPRLYVKTDENGKKYIEVPTMGPNKDGEIEDRGVKRIYKDDVMNNMNMLTTELGTKGEKIFGATTDLPASFKATTGPKKGQDISLEDLKNAGYSEDQIRQLIKDGKISGE